MKKSVKFSLMIQILGIYLFSLMVIMMISQSNLVLSMAESNANQSVFHLTDMLTGEKEEDFYNEPNSVLRLIEFNQKLHENTAVNYIEIINQPIYIESSRVSNVPQECRQGYSEGNLWPDADIDVDGSLVKVSPFSTYRLSLNAFDFFDIEIDSGRSFSSSDYKLTETSVVPALLGSSYQGRVEIGDTFYSQILDSQYTIEVVGFIAEGATIYLGDDQYITELDSFIVLPSFDLSTNSDKSALFVNYLQKNNGYFFTNQSIAEVQAFVQSCASDSSLENVYTLESFPVFDSSGLYINIQELVFLLGVLAAISFVFMFLNIVMSFSEYIDSQKYVIGVNLLCGASTFELFFSLRRMFIICLGVSFCLAMIVGSVLFVGSFISIVAVLLLSVILCATYLIIEIVFIKKIVPAEILKEERE